MWRSFDWRDHCLALRAGLIAGLLELLLRTAGLQACQRLLAWRRTPSRDESAPLPQVQHLADVIGFGCRHYALPAPACLARSLLLQHLLARRGIGTVLHLGSRIDESEFSAHAWVEYEGVALAEGRQPRELYAPFEPRETKLFTRE